MCDFTKTSLPLSQSVHMYIQKILTSIGCETIPGENNIHFLCQSAQRILTATSLAKVSRTNRGSFEVSRQATGKAASRLKSPAAFTTYVTSSRAGGARLAGCLLMDVAIMVYLLRRPVRRVVHLGEYLLLQARSVSHLHLLQHCRPNTLHPCCHPWERRFHKDKTTSQS